MKVFDKPEQVTNRAAYKKTVGPGLKKLSGAPEKFVYVEKFKFSDKVAPLLLVGEVSKDLLADIKDSMTTAAVEGKVKRSADKQLTFAPKKGTVAQGKLEAVL